MPLIDTLKAALVLLAITILTGCASTGPLPWLETTDYMERLRTETDGGVRVSTSVLSASESKAVYGKPLAKKGIQPVWIEVENHDDTPYWLASRPTARSQRTSSSLPFKTRSPLVPPSRDSFLPTCTRV
jgi:hypothetical protein